MKAARATLAAVALAASVLLVAPSSSLAQACNEDISGGIGDGGTYGAGGHADGCSVDGGGSGDGQYTVERIVRPEPSLCSGTPDGLLEILEYYDSAGNLVNTVSRCIGPDVPGDPLPPPPPAPAEVLRRLPLPMPEVHTSPPGQGLVGFETWFWWGAETSLPPVSVTVGEWSATVTPQLERITWDFGNGDTATSTEAGSEADPSVVYAYARQCECTITVTVTWGGQVTLSHPLLGAPITQNATGVGFSTSLPYEVQEREAVVVG